MLEHSQNIFLILVKKPSSNISRELNLANLAKKTYFTCCLIKVIYNDNQRLDFCDSRFAISRELNFTNFMNWQVSSKSFKISIRCKKNNLFWFFRLIHLFTSHFTENKWISRKNQNKLYFLHLIYELTIFAGNYFSEIDQHPQISLNLIPKINSLNIMFELIM